MGKIAIVFSGQGAQYAGMGQELYACAPAAKAVFDMAEGIRPGTMEQCFSGDRETLSLTVNTQPCVFCVGLAAAMALKEAGVLPQAVAGFSLGEVPALTYAGAFSPEEGFRLVCARGEIMHRAARAADTGMAAVLKLPDEAVEALCREHGGLYPVNYNCSGQLVVAGEKSALDALRESVRAAGGKFMPLNVSGGFHSPYMEEASRALEKVLSGFAVKEPMLPVYANCTASEYGADVKDLLIDQVKSPVRWQRTIENMVDAGFDTFIEAGPGKTLCGLIKKTAPAAAVYNVENKESLDSTINVLSKGAGAC